MGTSKVDYSKYSDDELFESLRNIDKSQYPENFRRLTSELELRKLWHPAPRSVDTEAAEPENDTQVLWRRKTDEELEKEVRKLRMNILSPALYSILIYLLEEISYALGSRGGGRGSEPAISFEAFLRNLVAHSLYLLAGFLAIYSLQYLQFISNPRQKLAICNSCFQTAKAQFIGECCPCGGRYEDYFHWKPVITSKGK